MKTTKLTARDRAGVRRRAAIEAYEAGYRAWPETSTKWGNQFVEQQLRRLADEMVQAVQADLQAEMNESNAWAELAAAAEAVRTARYRLVQARRTGTAAECRDTTAALVAAELAEVAADARLTAVRA